MQVHKQKHFDKICITNRSLCINSDYFKQIEKICSLTNGMKPDCLILREKDMDVYEYETFARKVAAICGKNGVSCILHTHIDVAIKLGMKDIHVPLHIMKETVPDILAQFDDIGISCHSVSDALEAQRLGCSYIIAGHIYTTDCKKGLEPRGISFLKEVCKNVTVPVYAIGGIDESRFEELYEAGAAGACIMSGYMKM